MGTLNDVIITKVPGGLGRRNPSQDMVSGLLFNGIATTKFKIGEVARLKSVKDAKAIGIDQAYDNATKGQSAYYQIEQYFRMNPSGDLYIMAVDKKIGETGAIASYTDVAKWALDMQTKASGEIRQMAIICSLKSADAATAKTVLKATAQAAQTEAKNAFVAYMPFEIIIEGKGFDVSASGPEDLKDWKSENVSVVIAMDEAKAKLDGKKEGALDANTPDYSDTAAVGVALGAVSRAKVSENIAWIQKFNISGSGFSKAGFVGAKKPATAGALETLNNFRYVFGRTHVGLAGIYFNDSHTCSEGTSDFAYIENNRTIHKATRLLRTALLPRLGAPILIDSDGKLPQPVTQAFENTCRAALEGMISGEEVSQFDVYVDPKQNVLATSELKVKAEIIPVGTARKITVDLGFKNPFGVDKA